MAEYTIRLGDLFSKNRFGHSYFTREEVESWFMDYNPLDYLTQEQYNQIVERGSWSKEKLAKKIVDHYFMREIGYETPALFKHYAKVKMQEIMEKEMPAIYSNSFEYDPLESVLFDITETREIEGKGKSSSESNSNGSGLSISSMTPQTNINKKDILSGKYASQANGSETETGVKGSTDTTSNTLEKFTHHEQGNKGVLDSYQKMVIQYREAIYAADNRIIEACNDLFMGIY